MQDIPLRAFAETDAKLESWRDMEMETKRKTRVYHIHASRRLFTTLTYFPRVTLGVVSLGL